MLNSSNIVVGGDLNVSLGLSESWGPMAQANPLADFFLNKLWMGKFIDVDLLKEKPTWRNKRVREAMVAKCLDQFFIKEYLAAKYLSL